MARSLVVIGLILAAATSQVAAHPNPPPQFIASAKPYTPYEFLIGDWYSELSGTIVHQRFAWGPRQSYIQYSTFMGEKGKTEQLHFDGIMVWNGKTKALDFLFALEPGSGVQEKGALWAEADGSLVRDIEFTDASGKSGRFRQTFRRTGEDSVVTSLMRQTPAGWAPTFPGSDALVMTRQPAG